MKRILALLAVLALAVSAGAELKSTVVSATATSQTKSIGAKSLSLVNDGANEIYVRVFYGREIPAAATTAYAEIKSGEGQDFYREDGIVAISIVCDTGETATVRLRYW